MYYIKEVKTHKEQVAFVEFPIKLYKNNQYFVPPLFVDEMKLFNDKKNPYSDITRSKFFLCYHDKKIVGRIEGIIQESYNKLHNEKRVRFCRFDAVNNKEVSKLLFDAVTSWAKNEGMDTICGPMNYSDLDREGLLIEGFDKLSTFEEQYSFAYYPELIEDYGFQKEVDWVEFEIRNKKENKIDYDIMVKKALAQNNLHIAEQGKLSKKQFMAKYEEGFFNVLDETYKSLYGVVPFTEKMKEGVKADFNLALDTKYMHFVCDENDQLVAFGLAIPSLSKAVQKSGGHLTIPCLLRIAKAMKKPEIIDFLLIGILPKYQHTGLTVVFLKQIYDILNIEGVDHCETNLNLEDNHAIISQWKYFDATQHKKRRSYIKKI